MRKQKRKFGYDPKRCFEALTINGTTVVFPEILKSKYGLSYEEIDFLKGLLILKDYELLPVRVDGVKNGEKVIAPPISVAVFDLYYGVQIQLEMETQKSNAFFSAIGITGVTYINAELELKKSLAKSIFKKVSPELFSKCF